jgi:putative spermidine/putrescine transport system ATP-binding protein
VVRPEKLSLTHATDTPDALAGVVAGLVYVGDCTRYLIDVEGGVRLTVKIQNRRTTEQVRPGERVVVHLDPADVRLLEA